MVALQMPSTKLYEAEYHIMSSCPPTSLHTGNLTAEEAPNRPPDASTVAVFWSAETVAFKVSRRSSSPSSLEMLNVAEALGRHSPA